MYFYDDGSVSVSGTDVSDAYVEVSSEASTDCVVLFSSYKIFCIGLLVCIFFVLCVHAVILLTRR